MTEKATVRRSPIRVYFQRDADYVNFAIKSSWFVVVLGLCFAILFAEIGAKIWLHSRDSRRQASTGSEVCDEPGDWSPPKLCLDTYVGYAAFPNFTGSG
jgi:hypothetical protein